MKLHDKLISIPDGQEVAALNELLDKARVSISWWGERLVTVDGFEESVTINELAKKFLSAHPLRADAPSLKDRLDYYALWGRVQALYTQSDEKLGKTWIYRFFVPLSEFRPYCRACAGDLMARIGEWDGYGKENVFEFSRNDFQARWPDVEPKSKSWSSRGEFWTASKEMVESALQQEI